MLKETSNASEEQKRFVTKAIVSGANIVSKGYHLLKKRNLSLKKIVLSKDP